MLNPEIRKLAEHLVWAGLGNHTVSDHTQSAFKLAAALLELEKSGLQDRGQLNATLMQVREQAREIERLRGVILAVNNAMALPGTWADANEVEHQITCHADTLPQYTRALGA